MNTYIKALIGVTGREINRMTSRPLYFLSVVILPLLSLLFFVSLMKEGVPVKLPVAVVDYDHTALSAKFRRTIDATPGSSVVMTPATEHEALSELRKGNIYGYVVLPHNLQADIMNGTQPVVRFYYQNGLLIAGGLIQNDLTITLHTLSAGVNKQKREAMGQNEVSVYAEIQPVKPDAHLLFNPETNYPVYVTSIMLPIMLQVFILMITVYSIGIEIKERTSREWLRKAGKSVFVALTGKLLPYTVIFVILSLFSNFLLFKALMVPVNTGVVYLVLLSLLYVLAYQAIAVFFVGLLPMMRHSLNLAAFYGILALTLCGFSFPIEHMPEVFRLWAEAFPVRHYMHIFQSQILAGFNFVYAAPSYLKFMLFLLLPFVIIFRLKSALIYQNFIEQIKITDAAEAAVSEKSLIQ
ncbi:MAG: ABC transporter permease [Lentimicrobium sp.]|uniref:ABC transporter permease n=1 Tax=Lentimicrobium sp. TaxID=2034841 RepID=UPI0025F490E4|nr:ABC transporter permease [Lentimicrobium sp.]MCO5256985.1 ABC transporter permease [Lentimicrobium sp.]